MRIHDIHDFDARGAARELLRTGATAVDDIGGQLIHHAEMELLEALGHAADSIEIKTEEIDTRQSQAVGSPGAKLVSSSESFLGSLSIQALSEFPELEKRCQARVVGIMGQSLPQTRCA